MRSAYPKLVAEEGTEYLASTRKYELSQNMMSLSLMKP